MHIPNRNSKPAVLLRESYRVGGNVRKRTLANLSKLPMDAVDAIKRILKGEKLVSLEDAFEIVENGSRLHGHVDAVLSAMRQLGFEKLVGSRHSRERDLVMAMVAARILEPQSKLATSLWWHTTTLPEILGVSDADEDDLYAAMDWVLERQEVIEKKLAARHLQNDGLALYDLTSSYFEGVSCPIAKLGYDRDGKKGKLQVNYGLLTNELSRFSWKMTVLKIRYTHEKRSCHEQTTPSSHRRAESRAVTPARSGEKASLGGMQRGRNLAEPVLHVAKGAIGWSPYGVFDPSRAEPRE